MMTFNALQAFVWIWLPESLKPIVAGKISYIDGKYHFVYGRSYLEYPDAISLSPIPRLTIFAHKIGPDEWRLKR